MNEACGIAWNLAPTDGTCQSVFAHDPWTRQRCEEVFGSSNERICPVAALGESFTGWANIMYDSTKTLDRLRAAALDTIWFYDQLRGMMVGEIAPPLNTTDISMHFSSFKRFSCLRNIPECSGDWPATTACEEQCSAVTDAIYSWLRRCYEVSRSTGSVNCSGLGSARDCDGTLARTTSSDQPGLCDTFQNKPLLAPDGMVNAAQHQLALCFGSLVVFVLHLGTFE